LGYLRPRRLPRAFFARPTVTVARELVGMLLIHSQPGGRTAGIIVETEAYTGALDPGSHACRGLKKRNAPMFGPAGKAYVYKCHLYPLLNVTTEKPGVPGAALIRALHPVAGQDIMQRRRRSPAITQTTSGPGKLCQALGIGLKHNRADLVSGDLRIARPAGKIRLKVARSTRIGLRGPASLLPRRFFASGDPFVSKGKVKTDV